MHMRSAQKALWIWIACFAVLMNALAPSISHAMAYADAGPGVFDICRADKSKPLAPGFIVDQKQTMSMGEDCSYCVTHGGSFGMPPSVAAGLVPVAQPSLHPFLFYRSPQPLAAWSASRPRGPPAPV
ncbi:DUF2946 domain-containing protein [Pseudoduganella sp. LjRoot289]|uniref:DUF2946 domain-containing protein n=1 Tax=Pseudoduganella sp. LjRoot289 TaxID=3342314 RepID=UPI003ECD71A7